MEIHLCPDTFKSEKRLRTQTVFEFKCFHESRAIRRKSMEARAMCAETEKHTREIEMFIDDGYTVSRTAARQ